jgi:hypothetical protein
MFPNPLGRFHSLNLSFSADGGTARTVFLRPNKFPGTILSREMTLTAIPTIMIQYSLDEVSCLSDVKLSTLIFQHVNPEHEI